MKKWAGDDLRAWTDFAREAYASSLATAHRVVGATADTVAQIAAMNADAMMAEREKRKAQFLGDTTGHWTVSAGDEKKGGGQ